MERTVNAQKELKARKAEGTEGGQKKESVSELMRHAV